jgi:hypothetical protein
VPGEQYFNVYPPPMVVAPLLPQTPIPLVSTATVTETGDGATTTLTWQSGADALALIALAPGQDPSAAPQTPAPPGTTVALTFANGSFTAAPSSGTGSIITVTVPDNAPPGSQIGLMIGPGPILIPMPTGGGSVVLTPDLTPTVTVRFGTSLAPGASSFSDETASIPVTFAGSTAAIRVGPDNTIVQTA